MPDPHPPLSDFLTERDELLRDHWRRAVDTFAGRVERFLQTPELYNEVQRLLVDLSALVERPPRQLSGDHSHLARIVAHLSDIREREAAGTTEMVFFLFSIRDALQATMGHLGSDGEEPSAVPRSLAQLSSLLHRLGIVLFESDVRSREQTAFDHDALAVEYALLYEQARRIAITDQLTKLFNFGYFRERLSEEQARADRYQRLLSLVIFDVDHFKHFNDANGHSAGNEVLKRVAQILQSNARDVDIAARYGGEELVILLPESTRRDATKLAQRICREVAGSQFPGMTSQPRGKITLSAGVATYPVDAATPDELVERADASLYTAKNSGRNKVVWYEPPHRETIVYRPKGHVDTVALVGSFNNWDKEYDYMYPVANGGFEFVISLNPGVYQYKFVVDGHQWVPDPECTERTSDGLGGYNSVLRVPSKTGG